MSHQLTTFSTVSDHSVECQLCVSMRHPATTHFEEFVSVLRVLRLKLSHLTQKIKEETKKISKFENQIRRLSTHENKRKSYKDSILLRLCMQSGYVHMLLRYSNILKKDERRLHVMVAQASFRLPLARIRSDQHDERLMAEYAPDLGAMLLFDFYPGEADGNTRSRESPDLPQLAEEQGNDSDEERYSVISDIFYPFGEQWPGPLVNGIAHLAVS